MPKRRIKWAKVDYLSLCPRGANRMAVVYKSDDVAAISLETLTKESPSFDEKGEVLAVAYPAEHRDAQGDIASADVAKEMAYSFMQSGAKLDLRHNNQVVPREKAYVAENFLIQKSDTRFHNWQDTTGKPVDLTGSWAVVLKVEDPELRKLYRSGAWNGVSFEGLAGFVLEKEDRGDPMDFEKFLKSLEESNKNLVATLVKELKPAAAPAPPAPEPTKKADEAPVFKGDPTNLAHLRKHLQDVQRYRLVKSVNFDDPDALAAAIEQLQKEQEAARASETPEQSADRLKKENLELLARLKKAERASNQTPVDTAPAGDSVSYGSAEVTKADADLGAAMAKASPYGAKK